MNPSLKSIERERGTNPYVYNILLIYFRIPLGEERYGGFHIDSHQFFFPFSFLSALLFTKYIKNLFPVSFQISESDTCSQWQRCENSHEIPTLFAALPPCPCTYPTGNKTARERKTDEVICEFH